MPQRLWIHRGVFGRHEVNYRDSEPFGGQMSEQAHAYFDCQTKKLCINQPYGGVLSSESEEAYKAYQLKALTEEKEALGMLVRGITLEINIHPGGPNTDRLFPEWQGAQKTDMPDVLPPMASIKLSVPESIDGIIKMKLAHFDNSGASIKCTGNSDLLASPIEYEKVGEKIVPVSHAMEENNVPRFLHLGNVAVLYINFYTEKNGHYELTFSFLDVEKNLIAGDKIILRG